MQYRFVMLCLVYFCIFYGSSFLVVGLSSPTGYYSDWIAHHANYVDWFRSFLINRSSSLLTVCGVDNHAMKKMLVVVKGIRVHVNDSCTGIGVISFWWAIVLAFPQQLRTKLIYFAAGTAVIITLNVCRISLLAYVFSSPFGQKYRHIDHHLIFNIILYLFVGLLIYRWLNIPLHVPPQKKIAVSYPLK